MDKNHSLFDEKDLVHRAKKDPEAFGELYDLYYAKIYRFILHRTAHIETAKDLTAETFFQALKNLWRFRFMKRPFSAWLYKIAFTQVAMYYREKKKYFSTTFEESPEIIHTMHLESSGADEMNVQMDMLKEFKNLHTLMRKLKEKEQSVLVLRYFEDKSFEEIGDILKMKINTVKSHVRRALLHLRELYNNEQVIFSYGTPEEKQSKKFKEVFEEK